jgi:hypothetical protein
LGSLGWHPPCRICCEYADVVGEHRGTAGDQRPCESIEFVYTPLSFWLRGKAGTSILGNPH